MSSAPVGAEAASRPPRVQTPGQWAVRWVGVVAMALLLLGSPLAMLVWRGGLGHAEPWVRTSTESAPVPAWSTLADGSWQTRAEAWLQAESPIAFALRSSYREAQWHLGVLQNQEVHVGRDGWLFLRRSLRPDPERLAAGAPARAAGFASAVAQAKALGVELVVAVVPDKERIYPEYAYADGVMPKEKAGLYAQILGELAAAGLPAVDLATPLLAAKPRRALYQPLDTHWLPEGALAAMQVVAANLESRFGDRLGPPREAQLTGPARIEGLPDLVPLTGMATTLQWSDELQMWVNRPASLTTCGLLAPMSYFGVALRSGPEAPWVPVTQLVDQAPVALAGSSFSRTWGIVALPFALRRPVDGRGTRDGASGVESLAATFDNLRAGRSHARVVVYEFVERAYVEGFPWPSSH